MFIHILIQHKLAVGDVGANLNFKNAIKNFGSL